jgi:hypothetical protein
VRRPSGGPSARGPARRSHCSRQRGYRAGTSSGRAGVARRDHDRRRHT